MEVARVCWFTTNQKKRDERDVDDYLIQKTEGGERACE